MVAKPRQFRNPQPLTFRLQDRTSSPGAEDGVALLIALIALTILSLVGFYLALNTTSELRISDNHESGIQAVMAARAGLNHVRELVRGIAFDDLLRGPDHEYSADPSYLDQARRFAFRNPLSWAVARSLDIINPSSDIADMPDDGVLNTGSNGASGATPLIPMIGIAQTAPNPYGPGFLVTSRYFVKATDNSGDASELALDPTRNPFVDGDGIIIIRSMGVARTIREEVGSSKRLNSVAVVEGRFKRRSTFNLGAPIVVQGSAVLPSTAMMFEGTMFEVNGGLGKPGVATIDINTGDGISPVQQIGSQISSTQENSFRGLGGSPSIADITGAVGADLDKALLLSPNFLVNFVGTSLPLFADNFLSGNQEWPGSGMPNIGAYDPTRPSADMGQDPKVTLVDGDLLINGSVTGGGLLVVRGRVYGSGRLSFNGLILLIGAGDLNLSSLTLMLNGGIYIASLVHGEDAASFGTPRLTISGGSAIINDNEAIEMGVRLIPPIQLGWRTISPTLDP